MYWKAIDEFIADRSQIDRSAHVSLLERFFPPFTSVSLSATKIRRALIGKDLLITNKKKQFNTII